MNRRFLYLAVPLLLCSFGLAQQAAPAQSQAAPHSATAHHTATSHAAPPPDKIWADLVEGNKRFVAGKPKKYALTDLRRTLAKGQHPNVIVLGCSDSRVAPELLFDQNLGDLFVVRSAGNIADPVGLGSMEYAVEHLGATVIVVMGHEKCGAVTAACSGEKMPTSNLQAIVDKIAPAVTQAKTYAKPDDLIEAAIKENVHSEAKELLAQSEVLRHAKDEGKLTIYETEYKLDSGEVVRLDNPQH
jgi:carbonic anhydrase